MRVDFMMDAEAAGRYQVVDLESGEEIENVAWADDDTGEYKVILLRGRTLADASDVDLRVKAKNGGFKVKACQGEIEIVDRAENPFKEPLLALLDDPDVVEKLRRVLGSKSFQALTGGDKVEYVIEDDPTNPTEYEYGIGTWAMG